jgi:hypothetical protein
LPTAVPYFGRLRFRDHSSGRVGEEMIDKKVASWVILGTAILLALATARAFAVPTNNRPNSIGVEQFYMNPNTYLFASIIAGQVLDGATTIRFQPYETMSLYEESVLFCGDVRENFKDRSGPIVVTYRRVSHRLYHGIACHEIVSVFEVHDDQVVVKP